MIIISRNCNNRARVNLQVQGALAAGAQDHGRHQQNPPEVRRSPGSMVVAGETSAFQQNRPPQGTDEKRKLALGAPGCPRAAHLR